MDASIASSLTIISIIPFVGMLLSIALGPLINPTWWGKHELLVSVIWSLAFCIPFGIMFGIVPLTYSLLDTVVLDYIPFIVLLLGLFIVAGGISIRGTLAGDTKTNVILLLIGTFLASWIGTTGAAMLMIRPMLRANSWRSNKKHIVVFFIFLVANMGGCLTPLGDPPLFLGYLRGVPFFWTIEHIWPIMLLNVVILLTVFAIIDRHYYRKEIAAGRSPLDSSETAAAEKIHIEGLTNLAFIAMIVVAVVLNGTLSGLGETIGVTIFSDIHLGINYFVQIVLILLAAILSLKTTKKSIREHNDFNYEPIAEVAKLFIGIFITMIPALALLRANGASLGLTRPIQFFWATGALSSFLDNSPTYVVFLTTAGSIGSIATSTVQTLVTTVGEVSVRNLLAISAGAVFMGANTYIGNAPNFMVKSIAEGQGVKMPSFFGYMGWSCSILLPLFALDSVLFFL